MAQLDVIELLRSPLVSRGDAGQFLRLVLAEAGGMGMDGRAIATLDTMAAILGFYDPLPPGQAAHLAGPLVNWRTHPRQPTQERVREVEELAFKQRALIAFGAARPGHLVGTAEILVACGNLLKDTHPPDYFDLFVWASLDVQETLTGKTKAQLLADRDRKDWTLIDDDEVLKPDGRLWNTYLEVATTIRRETIAAVKDDRTNPRYFLRPVAAHFVDTHTKVREEAKLEGLTGIVERLDRAIVTIRGMFPDLAPMETELEAHSQREVKEYTIELNELARDPEWIAGAIEQGKQEGWINPDGTSNKDGIWADGAWVSKTLAK